MRYVDLTLTLDHDAMPDEVLPGAAALVIAPREHADKGLLVGTETGTCLTLPAQFTEHRKSRRLHEVPPEALVLRETVVVDCPAEEGAEITADAVERAVAGAGVRAGDALLLRTGWGDRGLEGQAGTRYLLGGPRLALPAARALAARMRALGSDLLLTDLPLIARLDAHQIPEWTSLFPRPRPYPSIESTVYLHLYTPEKTRADYAVARVLAEAGIMTVKRLVGCGSLGAGRLRVIVGPLHLVRGVGSTCRVIAVEAEGAAR
jgi:kynurenine formamidase